MNFDSHHNFLAVEFMRTLNQFWEVHGGTTSVVLDQVEMERFLPCLNQEGLATAIVRARKQGLYLASILAFPYARVYIPIPPDPQKNLQVDRRFLGLLFHRVEKSLGG
jgi:hypothetical protein